VSITIHETFNVLLALLVTLFCHPIIIHMVERGFVGPLSLGGRWAFVSGFLRRLFSYLFIALFFSFLGVGVSLLPSPRFQTVVKDADVDHVQPSAYDSDQVDVNLNIVETGIGVAFIGTVLVICCLRTIVLLHHENLKWSLVYLMMSLSAFSLFTYLQNEKFYRVLFDSVVRARFPNSIWMIALGTATSTFLTEILLNRWVQRMATNALAK
jgi:hypothetical protein